MMYQKYARLINKMALLDQEMRIAKSWDETVDLANTVLLKGIVKKIGWPSISKVGKTASWNAWLIAQHADLTMMERSLALMKDFPVNDIAVDNIKYLEDRVLTFRFGVQIHGTQFKKDAG